MEVVCHELIVMTRVAGDIQSSSRRNSGGCRLGLKPLVRPGDRIRNHPLCIPALYMFKELSQFICIYFFSTDYHLRNGRASPWGLYRGMKAHGPECLSPAFLVNKGSRLEAMVDRIHCFFFFICLLEPRPLAHPRPGVIVISHWNGLRSAGLGSLINDHENGKIVIGLVR